MQARAARALGNKQQSLSSNGAGVGTAAAGCDLDDFVMDQQQQQQQQQQSTSRLSRAATSSLQPLSKAGSKVKQTVNQAAATAAQHVKQTGNQAARYTAQHVKHALNSWAGSDGLFSCAVMASSGGGGGASLFLIPSAARFVVRVDVATGEAFSL